MTPVIPEPADGRLKRVVILPFADYTSSFAAYGNWRMNVLVHEAVQDEFYRAGFIPAAEEGVSKFLTNKGVLKPTIEVSAETVSLQRELDAEWSNRLKTEFRKAMSQNIAAQIKRGHIQKPNALDSQTIKEMANTFGADYIIRGRVIDFRIAHQDTFNPFKTGILPVVLKVGQRTVFGLAETETYETIDREAIDRAFERAKADDTDLRYPWPTSIDYKRLNAMVWGGGGLITGALGQKQGLVPEATVQLRMLVQDALTGEIVWLNRAEVRTSPMSVWEKDDRDGLFATSLKKTVKSLVDNFVATLESGGIAKIDRQGLTIAAEMIKVSKKEASEAREAAAEARKAAAKANESAKQSKNAVDQAGIASSEARDAAHDAQAASGKSEKIFLKIIKK